MITTFDLDVPELMEALVKHSRTDWAGRPFKKNFKDADAAMILDEGIDEEQEKSSEPVDNERGDNEKTTN